MSKRQLITLFACSIIFFTNGNALMSLLPVYITRLGGDPEAVGYYFSLAFAAVAVGTLLTGWLSDRYQRRKLMLILSGAASVPLIWLMGQATDIAQLTLFTVLNWFISGVYVSEINILAGLFATEDQRGRVFGLLSSAVALGGLIGGLVSGPLVDRWGFSALFTMATGLAILLPTLGLLVQDRFVPKTSVEPDGKPSQSFTLSLGFGLLFVASVIAFITNATGILARPLMMDTLQFDATTITGTVAIGGLIGLPLPFLVGWLSDLIGRKSLLIICYVLNGLGLLVIVSAFAPWHFWLSAAFQFSMAASIAVGSALMTDLVPRGSLGVGLSLFTSTNPIGYVIGFAGTGIAMRQFDIPATLILGVVLSVVSVLLLLPIRAGGRKQRVKEAPAAVA